MSGRVRRKLLAARIPEPAAEPAICALCDRPLGARAEAHHVVPKSEGGTETALIHPICHRAIHAAVSNADLARLYPTLAGLRAHPPIARFIAWVADKPADFHAPTRRRRA